MKQLLLATAGAFLLAMPAFADSPVSTEEGEKIKAALAAVGCDTGKEMEKETEASGYFEVDDSKCKDGQFDFKLDKDFKVIHKTPD